MARLGHHDLWPGRIDFAGLDVVNPARLSQHVFETWHSRHARSRGRADHPTLQMPAITSFIDGSGPVFAGPVFPFVCITIACGAVSGFHSLIASGTTPK